jgi:hypothetical protein
MPKEVEIKKSFGAFYKKNAIDLCMWAYIQGVTDIFPSIGQTDAIKMFFKKFNILEEDYSIEAAVKNFQRINSDFIWKESK